MYQQIKPMYEGEQSRCIKRLPDNAFIPMDPDNRDYAEYLAWLEQGNTPLPAEEQQ